MNQSKMHAEIRAALEEYRSTRKFNPEDWINAKAEMLNEYMRRSHLKACVVNVSGGIDSAVTIMLAKRAQQLENSPIESVLGIVQPIHSTPAIMERATQFLDAVKVDYSVVDQTQVFDLLEDVTRKALSSQITDGDTQFASGQLKSYMRTPVAYYAAQLLSSSGKPAIVIGTGNYDEDGYLYYFCKPGDGTSDIQLIHDLHKHEVKQVAAAIGVTEAILEAPPSADLWPGQTDENELGFSYEYAELYIGFLQHPEKKEPFLASLSQEGKAEWERVAEMIERVHRRNSHKEKWPINLDICCPSGVNYTF